MLCFDDSEFNEVVDITLRNFCRLWLKKFPSLCKNCIDIFRKFGFDVINSEMYPAIMDANTQANVFIKPKYAQADFARFFETFFDNIATVYQQFDFIKEVFLFVYSCFLFLFLFSFVSWLFVRFVIIFVFVSMHFQSFIKKNFFFRIN